MKADRNRRPPRGRPASRPIRPAAADPATSPVAGVAGRRADVLIAAALFVGSFLLYVPILSNGSVDYDDPEYVGREMVLRGLTVDGVRWAFTTRDFGNWLPVTWLSHMLDVQLFGTRWGGHHATSAVLHAANAALVFLVLLSLTGARRRGAAAAALFAAHPVRVESVAWIAERKDVLSATFFLLALLAYAGWRRRPTALRYAAVVVAHALGLMSKTMLVTLPCVLLLLDFWPLRRLGPDAVPAAGGGGRPRRRAARLVLEKAPLFVLSAVACAWTVVIQTRGGMTRSLASLTVGERLANAAVAVPRYLGKLVWPADLSVFYPHPGRWPAWQVALSALLVVGLTAGAVAAARRRPYVTVGWLWFLGMLVPVSGVIQAGLQSIADRYMYLPSIGLLVAVVWAAGDAVRRLPALRLPAAAAAATAATALAACTWAQQAYWASTYDLFDHALAADPDNWRGHEVVAMVMAAGGDAAAEAGQQQRSVELFTAAAGHYQRSVDLNPDNPDARHNYGLTLDRLGRYGEAVVQYRRAVQISPFLTTTRFMLAKDLARERDFAAADAEFAETARRVPDNAELRATWGVALLAAGRRADAVAKFEDALRLDPANATAKAGLAAAASPPAVSRPSSSSPP